MRENNCEKKIKLNGFQKTYEPTLHSLSIKATSIPNIKYTNGKPIFLIMISLFVFRFNNIPHIYTIASSNIVVNHKLTKYILTKAINYYIMNSSRHKTTLNLLLEVISI